MSPEGEEAHQLPQAPLDPKETAYYAGHVAAWFSTRLEHDKSLLTLSTAAIGLLVTVLVNVGARTWPEVLLFGAAFIVFFLCLCASLVIFRRNSDYIERVIQGKDTSYLRLKRWDGFLISSFIIGVVFACVLAGVIAQNRFEQRGVTKMTENKAAMPDVQKSFEGSTNLKPTSPNSAPSSSTPSQPAPPTSSQGTGKKN